MPVVRHRGDEATVEPGVAAADRAIAAVEVIVT